MENEIIYTVNFTGRMQFNENYYVARKLKTRLLQVVQMKWVTINSFVVVVAMGQS